jgi:hypothetical protein
VIDTKGAPDSFRDLAQMMAYRRPHGSKTERKFINRFIRPLGVKFDDMGNMYKIVGDDPPTILWSSHTDSVHRAGGKQKMSLTGAGLLRLKRGDQSNCLGADNAAGVWMCIEMIKAGIPGLYVFHRQEESGCVGSQHFAETQKELLSTIQSAVAFDRRGIGEVITWQMCGQTASNEFAQSMCDLLDLGHKPSENGIYTDTASYEGIIPECTNIAVGFYNEHSSNESLDVMYLGRLRDAVLKADFSKLVIKRKPGENGYSFRGRGGYQEYNWEDWVSGTGTSRNRSHHSYEDNFSRPPGQYGTVVGSTVTSGDGSTEDYEPKHRSTSLLDLVEANPSVVADILEQIGYDAETLEDEIDKYHIGVDVHSKKYARWA